MRSLLVVLAACSAAPEAHLLPPDAPLPLDPAVEARVDAILAGMTLEERVGLMAGTTILPRDGLWRAAAAPEHGVPGLRMSDGPRGVTAGRSTAFPVAMARAAAWDPALEERVGEAIGRELAAQGGNVLLAPALNVLLHPAWGRAQEVYGEDPHLMARLGVAFTVGAQRHVVATAKHFAANNMEDNRFEVDVTLDPRTLREVYLPHFRAVVREAGVGAVMTAYNSVNGAFAGENGALIHDVLKDGWGFQGVVMSDWLWGTHDGAASARAGLDLEMPLPDAYADLADLVAEGEVAEAAVEEAARRLVRLQLAHGLDAPDPPPAEVIGGPEHVALAREAAAAGVVLLRNQGALPLPADLGAVAVVGALADDPATGDIGSSAVSPARVVTPLAGLTAALGADRVLHVDSDDPDAEALAAIGAADAAVVVVGLTPEDEGEHIPGRAGGDRRHLGLPDAQVELLRAVAGVSDRVIVLVRGGSAVTVEGWLDDVEAVLVTWYAGQEGGHAVADVLLGAVSPSGKLPLTLPTGPEQLPPFEHQAGAVTYPYLHGYRHMDRAGLTPRFPFGFGLSYTTFRLDAPEVDPVVDGPEGALTVRLTVTNTGDVAGAEVVQVYLAADDPDLGLPDRFLGAFAKVALPPGGAERVTLTVPARALATWSPADEAWALTPGAWRAQVGTSSRDLPWEVPFEVR